MQKALRQMKAPQDKKQSKKATILKAILDGGQPQTWLPSK
jgi:hypothetical protein